MLPNVCCVCVTNTLFSCESENFGFLLLVRRLSSNCYIHTQFNRNVAHTRFRSTCTQSDHCIINFSLAFVVVVVVCFSHALWICKAVSNGFFILFNFQNNTTKNPTASSFFLSPFMYGGFFLSFRVEWAKHEVKIIYSIFYVSREIFIAKMILVVLVNGLQHNPLQCDEQG